MPPSTESTSSSFWSNMGVAHWTVFCRSAMRLSLIHICATPGEIYHMCLQKHVSRTLYHDPHPLRYQAGEKFSETEVPACAIELTLPANSKWQLIVAETEPIAHTLSLIHILTNGYSDRLQEMVRILNTLPAPNFPDGRPSAPYNFSLATHKEKQLL